MVLTSAIAKDMEKLISKTDFDPVKTLSKLDFYLGRKRITTEEYNYLVELMESKIAEDVAEQLTKQQLKFKSRVFHPAVLL